MVIVPCVPFFINIGDESSTVSTVPRGVPGLGQLVGLEHGGRKVEE